MAITISRVAGWLGLEVEDERILENFATDSRAELQNGLYIPVKGARVDGHDFVDGAVEGGAIAALWKKGNAVPEGLVVLEVEDTVKALQQIAKRYLDEVDPKVVAITGSNGKTSTKDMVESVLAERYKTHKTKGNFNSDIGLPLTVLHMPEDTEVAVLEMGMSGFGDIAFLSELAEPDIALVTNIGESHAEHVGGRQGIAKAKLEIKQGLKPNGLLIVDGDEPLLEGVKALRVGYNSDCDRVIEIEEASFNGTRFLYAGKRFAIPVLGPHQVRNAVYAIECGLALGLSEKQIQQGLDHVHLTPMRMERLFVGETAVINDAYNASPTSMIAAVGTLKLLGGYPTKVAVLGDMYELGENERQLHASVGAYISLPITHAILVGEKGRWISEGISDPSISVEYAQTIEEAEKLLSPLMNEKTVVLLKASRGMALEKLLEQLNS